MQSDTLQVLNSLNEKIDYLINNSGSEDIILAAFVGASAAIIPQLFIYYLRTRKDKNNKLFELKSELFRLIELLRDHYRELALHKAHKVYWWAHYEIEKTKEEKGHENEAKKMHDFHMNSSSNVRTTELKISETFSLYNKVVSKIQMLTVFNKKVQKDLNEYKNHEPLKPNKLNIENQDLLPVLESEEESRLKEEYKIYINILENINSQLVDGLYQK